VKRLKIRDLSEIERKTYEFIKEVGEIQPKNMPDRRMVGAIANLKNKGLVEIYKKYTSFYRRKKRKFVKAKRQSLARCQPKRVHRTMIEQFWSLSKLIRARISHVEICLMYYENPYKTC